MKNFKLTTLVLVFLPLFCFSQYTWEEVALPDSIGAGSICFYGTDTYLATGNGVYHSDDNCENWTYIGPADYPTWSLYISPGGQLYAGARSTIYRYLGNNQWDSLYTTLDKTNILSIYESYNGSIFFGNWGGIFRSTDGGINWTEVLDLGNTEVIKAIVGNSVGTLFAGSISFSGDISPGGIYSSTDGGATWQLTGLSYHFVSSMVINADDEIFVGTNGNWYTGTGRIYKSTDNGLTWDIVFDNHYILSLSINEYNEIAAASETGIFCTYDDGVTWENITPSDTVVYYEKVTFHPQNNLYVISYFEYADLYRTLGPVSVNNHYIKNSQNEISLYPNPSHNRVSLFSKDIQYNEIYITDLSGRIMRKIKPQHLNTIEIRIEDLPPAIYLIRCKSDHKINTVKFIKY